MTKTVSITAPPKLETTVTLVGKKKYDANGGNLFREDPLGLMTDPSAIQSNALEYEDEFKGVYGLGALRSEIEIIEPTFNFLRLEELCDTNNALPPCIAAMVANIDGTGWKIGPFDPEEAEGDDSASVEDAKIDMLYDFFGEPWPGESFATMRKKLRKDLERTGNAYLEILRNAKDEIVFARWIEAKTMRLIGLDKGFYADVTMMRGGKSVTLKVHVRRRRYIQKINERYTYFKEFGSERDVDRDTGMWATEGQRLGAQKRGTEIIHFIVDKDIHTPYGVPRWIAQTPSIMGSRKAEETNLTYFDAGGVPPALIFVKGAQMAVKARQALDTFMSASAKAKTRAAVIEIPASDGNIGDKMGVGVQVERFGAESADDSMFSKYDVESEEKVRRAFRLPALFVGVATDFSYAAVYASYTVAEAQVFKPEREEFDEIITLKLVRALTGSNDYRFSSNPLSVNDVVQQFTAVQAAFEAKAITREEYIETINSLMGLELEVSDQPEPAEAPPVQSVAPTGGNLPQPGQPGSTPAKPQLSVVKSEQLIEALADDMLELAETGDYGLAYRRLMQDVADLQPSEMGLFRTAFARKIAGAAISPTMGSLLDNAARILSRAA